MSDPTQPPPSDENPFAASPEGVTPPPPASDVPPPPPAPAYGTPPPPPPAYAPAPAAYGAPAATVPNNMGLSIGALVAGLCCAGLIGLATGIIAVVFASQVNGKAAVGDIAGATESARKARLFSLITFVIAAIGIVIGIIIVATGGFEGKLNVGT